MAKKKRSSPLKTYKSMSKGLKSPGAKKASPLARSIVYGRFSEKLERETFPGKKLTAADRRFAHERVAEKHVREKRAKTARSKAVLPKSRGRRGRR